MDVDRFLDECEADGNLRGRLVHVERIPPRAARYGRLKEPLPDEILQSLAGTGVRELFTHQVDAIEALRRGENIVVVTGTASGKTLCYNIPVLETIAHDPSVRALYLFPTKALAQDQLRALAKLGVPTLGPRERQRGGRRVEHLPNSSQQALPGMADAFWPPAGTYDGDTPKVLRSRMRSEAGIVLSNPDMVHAGMLPSHGSWSTFLAGLRYVVIDELHACRGVFGSHTANVIRRLRHICRNYGSSPQFICCSATIANPVEHAEAMVGLPMMLIDDDGSPRGKRAFALWNPPLIDAAQGIRKSANTEAAELMPRLVVTHEAQTIAFTRSRSTAEVLCNTCASADLRRYHGHQSRPIARATSDGAKSRPGWPAGRSAAWLPPTRWNSGSTWGPDACLIVAIRALSPAPGSSRVGRGARIATL